GHRPHALGIGVGLGLRAHRGAPVAGGRLLGLRADAHPEGVALRLLLGPDQVDALAPLGLEPDRPRPGPPTAPSTARPPRWPAAARPARRPGAARSRAAPPRAP